MLFYLRAHIAILQVGFDTQAAFFEPGLDLGRVVVVGLADGDDDGLGWREPGREGTGEMLDQDADEAFEAAEGGAMDHDRALAGVVAVDVFEVEALGQVVVDLDCAQLPFALEDIADDEV